MYEKLNKCPLCKEGGFSNAMIIEDHAISKESFTICKCENCNLLFTNPRPDEKNIHHYYESPNYISHSNKTNGWIDLIYKSVRRYTIRQKLLWLKKFHPKKGRLLDYGCGTGNLLKEAKKDKWITIGIEPNQKAREIAIQKELDVRTNLVEIQKEKKFDVISLFHVLEHVHNLDNTIKQLLDRLKKRGILFIAVPNHESHDRKHFENYWASYDIPRHLYHFENSSMEYLANKYKLKIKDRIPMLFDSYYISLLSDKYQKDNSNPISSFFKGLKFNKKAKSDGNYSSIVYVLKKQ
ncbi:class I SAM-dependent methyltransferase [Pleomorphovibrio marinus]|uniref:class I SAM-dependent methyltransferase n=1 Tax=Pleomorphovibrio marinus TaxID=2164132 RepID=UPI000E0A10A0|nr:class I SAM-dependent methyltransferase [Pleomorphovibrio marinus]